MIAGISNYSIEVGDSRIDSLDDSASTNSTPAPQVNLNVKYTFSTQTQLFLGNSLEDVVQLDLITLFGARQQFSDSSIVELSAVTTPSFGAAQTWAYSHNAGPLQQRL